MDRYSALQRYKDIVTLFHVRSNVRDLRPASVARRARRRPCGWLTLDAPTLLKNYHTTKEIKIGISAEIITELAFALAVWKRWLGLYELLWGVEPHYIWRSWCCLTAAARLGATRGLVPNPSRLSGPAAPIVLVETRSKEIENRGVYNSRKSFTCFCSVSH